MYSERSPPPPPPPPPASDRGLKQRRAGGERGGTTAVASTEHSLRRHGNDSISSKGRNVGDATKGTPEQARGDVNTEQKLLDSWDWWLTGSPCLLLVLAYGGTASLLSSSLGLLIWYILDLSGPEFGGVALAVW